MQPATLYFVRKEKVKKAIPLSSKETNFIATLNSILKWNEQKKWYEIFLSPEGVEEYYDGIRYKINNRKLIKPRQKYTLRSGDFICPFRVHKNKFFQLYLHHRSSQYLILKKIQDLPAKKIFLCIDTYSNSERVILKLKRESSGHFDRFVRSTLFLRKIKSNHLASFRSAGNISLEGGDYTFQSFDYFRSKPLHNQELPLSVERATKIFHQVALALRDLAQAGLVHRNLKPEHILIDKHDSVRLVGLTLLGQADIAANKKTLLYDATDKNKSMRYALTGQNEIACGDLNFVPSYITKPEKRDLYAALALFLWSLQNEKYCQSYVKMISEGSAEEISQQIYHYWPEDFLSKKPYLRLMEKLQIPEEEVEAEEVVELLTQDTHFQEFDTILGESYIPLEEVNLKGAQARIYSTTKKRVESDFYDILALGKDKNALIIGSSLPRDSSQYIYTQLLYPSVCHLTEQRVSAANLLEQLNEELYSSKEQHRERLFASALYGIISNDELSRYFMYSSANHPPPVLYRQGEARFLRLQNSHFFGTSLGIAPDHFRAMENFVHLQTGDTLFLYTQSTRAEGEVLGAHPHFLRVIEKAFHENISEMLRRVVISLGSEQGEKIFDSKPTMIAVRIE